MEHDLWQHPRLEKKGRLLIGNYTRTAKLAEGMTNKVGVPTSEGEAQALMDRLFEAYPRLKEWYLTERARAEAGGDRTRTLTGRLRLLDKEYRFGKWRANLQMRLNTPSRAPRATGSRRLWR